MNEPTDLVFDSWALLAYLQGEAPVKQMIELLTKAHETGASMAMSTVNAGEVWYITDQRRGSDEADRAIEVIRSLGIEIVDTNWTTTLQAARYKTNGGISYADCFAAALAKHRSATLVTGDPEFKRVEKDISITWL